MLDIKSLLSLYKNVFVCLSVFGRTDGYSVKNNNAFGPFKQKEVGVHLHTELSRIQSKAVTRDAHEDAL